jgi:FAD:protein FMN transferase
MSGFRAMGCEIVLSAGAPAAEVQPLFDERDRRFSRFIRSSELNRVNATPAGVCLVSEEFAAMTARALAAARATGGLVTPGAGAALLAAGYDRDFAELVDEPAAVEPERLPGLDSVSLRGRMLLRTEPVVLDLNGAVKSATVDDALTLIGSGWVAAGGDLATTHPVVVGLPEGGTVTLFEGGLATSSVAKRTWLRAGIPQHHLIDPATGSPSRSPWRDVTVAAQNCVAADVAAKAALLLGHAGPSWLDHRGLPGRFVDGRGAVHLNETWRRSAPSTELAA